MVHPPPGRAAQERAAQTEGVEARPEPAEITDLQPQDRRIATLVYKVQCPILRFSIYLAAADENGNAVAGGDGAADLEAGGGRVVIIAARAAIEPAGPNCRRLWQR